jgi:ABC-type multidrug transport system permease subunit
MEQVTSAAMFFTASLLYGAGFVMIAIFIIIVNNLIHRFWKYLGWFRDWNFTQTNSQPERLEPRVKE